MDRMDNGSFKILIDYLEIQEYVMFLTISKNIFNQAKRYVKIRQPHITVVNNRHGGFGISALCRTEMKNLGYNDNGHKIYNYYISRSDPVLIRAILKIGSEQASGTYAELKLYAVPWMFRECTKIDEYDGLESLDINYDAHIRKLLEKYKNKIENTVGLNEKKEMESFLFRKLVQKHDFLNNYNELIDKHMIRFNEHLDDMIRSKSSIE